MGETHVEAERQKTDIEIRPEYFGRLIQLNRFARDEYSKIEGSRATG